MGGIWIGILSGMTIKTGKSARKAGAMGYMVSKRVKKSNTSKKIVLLHMHMIRTPLFNISSILHYLNLMLIMTVDFFWWKKIVSHQFEGGSESSWMSCIFLRLTKKTSILNYWKSKSGTVLQGACKLIKIS